MIFSRYLDIEKTYNLSIDPGRIYQTLKEKRIAFSMLAKCYDKIEKAGFKTFNSIAKSIQEHYLTILNFFDSSTNALAESFNAKIKAFRPSFSGVKTLLSSFLDYLRFMLESTPRLFGLIH
ncbi:MAG: transposase [Bacteroidota bacterium]